MPKMNEEHKAFLSSKSEKQIEHIAGCEQCFNYYLFGEQYRCKEYPSKHRIKESDFQRLLRIAGGDAAPLGFTEHSRRMLEHILRLIRVHFGDELLAEETLDEVTIVPDTEWDAVAAAGLPQALVTRHTTKGEN